jgi:CubicO group peptidase (beta-lactamase class C family)
VRDQRNRGMGVSPSALGDVLAVFEENFRSRGELGASVSVWWQGTELLSLGDGWCEREKARRWTERTLVPVYSATKGPAAAALLVALDAHGLGVETPVIEVWPGFPVADASFGDLLSHQCGLAALDQRASLWNHDEGVAAVEAQVPAWRPGEGHGYHPRSFGVLVDEPVRRLTGLSLGEWWQREIAEPLELDFWIGLPESEWPRVARMVPGRIDPGRTPDPFYQAFGSAGTLTWRAFHSPEGLHSVQEMNEPRAWSAGFPAMGGVGTARGLAKFYQAAIGALASPLSVRVRAALAELRASGDDRVLLKPTAFTAGCQRDPLDEDGRKIRELYGPSLGAFGHPGAGGSHGFGDPDRGLSFAYVMNRMELGVMPGERCQAMIRALAAEG